MRTKKKRGRAKYAEIVGSVGDARTQQNLQLTTLTPNNTPFSSGNRVACEVKNAYYVSECSLTTYVISGWYSIFPSVTEHRSTHWVTEIDTVAAAATLLLCLTIDMKSDNDNIVISGTRNQCMGSTQRNDFTISSFVAVIFGPYVRRITNALLFHSYFQSQLTTVRIV